MTTQLGDLPLPAIEEMEIESAVEDDEIDLIDKNQNILVTGEETARNIVINAVLAEQLHPERLNIDDQRQELKKLSKDQPIVVVEENGSVVYESDVTELQFRYNRLDGIVIVEDVSLQESSDLPTYREAKIRGKFLPWPKHKPNEFPLGTAKRMSGSQQVQFDFLGDAEKVDLAIQVAMEGNFDAHLDLTAYPVVALAFGGGFIAQFDTIGSLDKDIPNDRGPFGNFFGRRFGGTS